MKHFRNPVLARLPEYSAGKPIEELAAEKGLTNIIKLASNENPLGPSPAAQKAFIEAAKNLHRYPDNACRRLSEKIADFLRVPPDKLIFGTGSDDIMHLAVWAFGKPGTCALVPSPGFLGYPIFAESFGLYTSPVPLPEYEWDLDAFLRASKLQDASVVFLAAPNNPTGTSFTHEALLEFLRKLPTHIMVILDLAYAEFDADPDKPDMIAIVEEFSNVVACRTFSKAYGIAGLRLGYGFSRLENIQELKKLRTPFAANGPALEAALAALQDKQYLEDSIRTAREGTAWWTERLASLGLHVIPTQANFVMVRFKRDVEYLYRALLDRGIILRWLKAFGRPDALRITAGTPEENETAFSILKDILQNSPYA